ncbi:hypothetical protein Mgra_00010006 [Meloidogyne graminicola]|uniref:Protein aurora borealis n=1 Tax=Meloidogyne graminicola TaxID=189291 RepID=A0A8S9Z6C4_9BILA|nr:hypothetical protein Mgra_00010006 [Meloidogyne graminicola]
MDNAKAYSVFSDESNLKQQKSDENVAKPCINEDSQTNLFKRHKVYSSPKNATSDNISQTPPSNDNVDSVFVTPGIYRRKVCKSRVKESNEEAKFAWTVDELAVFRPVHFDESEFSLPPDDWNPNPNYDVEKYWNQNKQIFPSPDVQNIPWTGNYSKSSTSSSPACQSHSYDDLYSSKSHWHSGTETSSIFSTFKKRFTTSENSPQDVLLFKSFQLDCEKEEKEGVNEFEKIEQSFSFGDDADRIFADLEFDGGSFVMRQQANSPIEVGEKYIYFREVSYFFSVFS